MNDISTLQELRSKLEEVGAVARKISELANVGTNQIDQQIVSQALSQPKTRQRRYLKRVAVFLLLLILGFGLLAAL